VRIFPRTDSTALLYRPGRSIVHRTPAGLKILAMLACSVLMLRTTDWSPLAGAVAGALVVHWIGTRRLALAAQDTKVGVIQGLLFGALMGLFSWSWAGAVGGFQVGVKIVLLCLVYGALVRTTSTSQLHAFFTRVLPWRWAWLMAVAFQFLPVLCREFASVVEAQRSRGWRLRARDLCTPWGLVHVLGQILVPVLVRTVQLSQAVTCVAVVRGVAQGPMANVSHRPPCAEAPVAAVSRSVAGTR